MRAVGMRLMPRRRRQRPQGRHSRKRDKVLGHRFDRVAESEFGEVDGAAHKWQRVHQPGDQGVERRAEIGILPSQFFQFCLFISRVDEDRRPRRPLSAFPRIGAVDRRHHLRGIPDDAARHRHRLRAVTIERERTGIR